MSNLKKILIVILIVLIIVVIVTLVKNNGSNKDLNNVENIGNVEIKESITDTYDVYVDGKYITSTDKSMIEIYKQDPYFDSSF